MAISDLSHRLQSMSRAMPGFVFSQNRAIANASASVERDRRAAAERAAAEAPGDLESVIRTLAGDVVA